SDGPRLLAVVGARDARLALEAAPGRLSIVNVLPCDAYTGLALLIRDYLARSGVTDLRHAAIAIANPIEGDRVHMTNRAWTFSIEAMRRALHLDTLLVVNDFTALAQALPSLG